MYSRLEGGGGGGEVRGVLEIWGEHMVFRESEGGGTVLANRA